MIEATYALIDDIKKDRPFNAVKKYKKDIAQNKEVQTMIETFSKAKEDYDDARQYGLYHPDLSKYKKKLSNAKNQLYKHPVVKAYKAAENDLQQQLDTIADSLAQAISKHINVDMSLKTQSDWRHHTCKKDKV